MIELTDDVDAFLTFLSTRRSRPIAFLTGAPLSHDEHGGVPLTRDMVQRARSYVQQHHQTELPRLDAAIARLDDGAAYQTAMKWIRGNFGQSVVNEIVHAAVLESRLPGAPENFDGDGAWADWYIPKATLDMARLVVGDRERFSGPLLTTNFDPLMAMAIRRFGALPRMHVVDADRAGIPRAADVDSAQIDIVPIHGYWRESATMHTVRQLTSPRPKLTAALCRELRRCTLVVVAYGGWDDVFTTALASVLEDDDADVEICWCFYENDDELIRSRYRNLLGRLERGIETGKINCYRGIDCHDVFERLATPTTQVVSAAWGALPGWEAIDSDFLDSLSELSKEELVRYFDGALPTWRHARSSQIPRRQAVSEIVRTLQLAKANKADSSAQLVRAAGGEGKSTILLQAGIDAVMTGEFRVLWRRSPDSVLDPEAVADLNPSVDWLLIADDAETLIEPLFECARLLHERARANVHFLLAARDTDWRAKRGDTRPWQSLIHFYPQVVLRGLSADDASGVVDAWSRCGDAGLRELAGVPDVDRATSLMEAVAAVDRDDADGSFFGGLLTVRFGEEGLYAHVRELLQRLRSIEIDGGDASLYDALLFVAACHAADIPGLDLLVLADLVGVPSRWCRSRVVVPLGEEAAAAVASNLVVTRHHTVAAAIVAEADSSFVNFEEVWAELVRRTIETARRERVSSECYGLIVHAGPRLQRTLPRRIGQSRRTAIALAAARAALEANRPRIDHIVDLAAVYRLGGKIRPALELLRARYAEIHDMPDYNEHLSGYFLEWAVCEGRVGSEQAYWNAVILAALSLSDQVRYSANADGAVSFAGLVTALGRVMYDEQDGAKLVAALRAALVLGNEFSPSEETQSLLDIGEVKAGIVSAPYPKGIPEALRSIAEAAEIAQRHVADPLLADIVNEYRPLTFRAIEQRIV